MRVWIDLHNSPHPLLFAPVIREFSLRGHDILLTARDNAQTLELARTRWPDVSVIGGPSPAPRLGKVVAIGQRIGQLRRWAKRVNADVALSHNSYAQLVAARLLGIPGVTAMDYEGQPANHVAFRIADRILIPDTLPRESVRWQGASNGKTISYPGLKEEIYLGDFTFDPDILAKVGLDATHSHRLVVTRPPPSGAAYHQFDNPLYLESLKVLARQDDLWCVVLARSAQQRAALRSLDLDNLVFPDRAVDSRSLMYAADLVVGAGGTMTREAALLGVPTYSVFAGSPSAVDSSLVRAGVLRRLNEPSDLEHVSKRRADPLALDDLRERSRRIIDMFIETTMEVAGLRQGPSSQRESPAGR